MKPCFDYALRHVSRYPKTTYSLRTFLLKKGYSAKEIDETIKRLTMLNFLDDNLYAELYIRGETIRKGKPIFIVKQKLFKKGIGKDILQSVCEEYEEDIYQGMCTKVLRELKNMSQRGVDQKKMIQRLTTKGYAFDLVHTCIDEYVD